MTIQISAPVTSLGQLVTRRHDQLQELVPDDDHLQYMVGLGADITLTQVINTAAETTIASVNLGPLVNAGLASGELLRIVWRGIVVNNTGADQTFRMFLKTSAAQTLADSTARPLPTTALERSCLLEAHWHFGATRGDAVARVGAPSASPPTMDSLQFHLLTVFDLGTLNAGVDLLMRVQFGAANAQLWCTSYGLWVGKCRGPR